MADLRESVQYHIGNINEVNKKLEDIDSRVEEVKLDEITEDFVTKAKKKLGDLEDHNHWNNLRFDGFPEESNERWEKSESIVTDFVKKKLGIEEDNLNWKSTSHGGDREKWRDKR